MDLPACFESGAQDASASPAAPPAASDPPAAQGAGDPPAAGDPSAPADPSAAPGSGPGAGTPDLPWECQMDEDVLADYDPYAAAEDASLAEPDTKDDDKEVP